MLQRNVHFQLDSRRVTRLIDRDHGDSTIFEQIWLLKGYRIRDTGLSLSLPEIIK